LNSAFYLTRFRETWKFEARNPKQSQNDNVQNPKQTEINPGSAVWVKATENL
jgi:hypothetical protein